LVITNEARVEPALAQAEKGSRYQFIRQGYFFVDPIGSRPGVPAFNRIIGLKDTWAKGGEKVEEQRAQKKPKAGRRNEPTEPRARDPVLQSIFDRYRNQLGLSNVEAELLARDRDLASFFDAAIEGNRNPKLVAKWLSNELLALTKGRGIGGLPFDGKIFGRMVALVDAGKITPGAGKRLLGELVARGGDPEALVKQLGLEKLDDTWAIDEAVAKVLQSQAVEVARYRAGERKLFGVLLGAVMRETKGAADAGAVRKALTEKLG
jgi:Glu-tRNA(Gln) amidotransferase subunit E-like FAD-binding protein